MDMITHRADRVLLGTVLNILLALASSGCGAGDEPASSTSAGTSGGGAPSSKPVVETDPRAVALEYRHRLRQGDVPGALALTRAETAEERQVVEVLAKQVHGRALFIDALRARFGAGADGEPHSVYAALTSLHEAPDALAFERAIVQTKDDVVSLFEETANVQADAPIMTLRHVNGKWRVVIAPWEVDNLIQDEIFGAAWAEAGAATAEQIRAGKYRSAGAALDDVYKRMMAGDSATTEKAQGSGQNTTAPK